MNAFESADGAEDRAGALGEWVRVASTANARVAAGGGPDVARLQGLQGTLRTVQAIDADGLHWLDWTAANQSPDVGLPADQLVFLEAEAHEAGEGAIERREMQVVADLHDVRLDKALQRLAPEFSRNYLQQLLRDGQVWLDGRSVRKPAAKVSVGQHLALSLRPTPQSQAFQPEAMRLDIRYEDAHLLVLDKPAGLVVHPAAGNWSGTLLNGLLAYHPVFGGLPRAGIVHRLDKDTSGLMVVAKSMPMVAALVERIASREVSRQYLAVVHGGARTEWPWQAPGQSVRVDAPIGRDPAHRQRMAVVDLERQAGKPAQTDVELLARSGDYALVYCRLHTGRTHQIRVHMRHLGLPLVGDALYGGVGHPALQRQALHAWRLGFVHPHTGQALALQTALPADLQALLAALSLPIEALPA